jgi:hypothetical protein
LERLSSRLTFFYKVVFTTVWPAAFGLAALVVFLQPAARAKGAYLGLLAVGTLGAWVLWRACSGLKRVDLDGNSLVVSNYRRSIRVPLNEISGVRQKRLLNIRPITIAFKRDTEFGRWVVFMPPFTMNLLSEDPVAHRLRTLGLSK